MEVLALPHSGHGNNMKKICSICSVGILFISVSLMSCANKKAQAVVESELSPEVEKAVTAAKNIASMIMDGNLESAYYRMHGDFRAALSYGTFRQNWELAANPLGKLESFAVDTSEYSSLNFYKVIKIDYQFTDGNLVARYLFKENDYLPADVTLGGKPIPALENVPPLKDLCAQYFKFGCGISGYNDKSSALNVDRFMEIVEEQFSSCTSTNLMKPVYVLNQKMSRENLKNGLDAPGLDFSSIYENCKSPPEISVSYLIHPP